MALPGRSLLLAFTLPLLLASVLAAPPARAHDSCRDSFDCLSDDCWLLGPGPFCDNCRARILPSSTEALERLIWCAQNACTEEEYDDDCVEEHCGAELEGCPDEIPEGAVQVSDTESGGGLYFTAGGGWDFAGSASLAQLAFGWEQVWLFGSGSEAAGASFGVNIEVDGAFTDEASVLVLWGTLSGKYYTPMDVSTGYPYWTFGVGGRVGGGALDLSVPFVGVLPSISGRMIHNLNVEVELWGGPGIAFGDEISVAWLLGADVRFGFLWSFEDP
jgi:hypothetical protein